VAAGDPFVRLFNQAPAVAPARKVATKLSIVNISIMGKARKRFLPEAASQPVSLRHQRRMMCPRSPRHPHDRSAVTLAGAFALRERPIVARFKAGNK
jgi:hypothetical protein